VKTIFYPCVTFNDDSVKGQDNTFNCPIVATYPEVIRNNMARLTEDRARFISPFLSLHNKEKLPARLAEIFADWDVT
ncbi:acyl-CoA dehydratase activase-related protein, partial [Lactobacillus paragasseri]